MSAFGVRADIPWTRANVRYWHKADIGLCAANVRYWGQRGHAILHCICPLVTQSGHRQNHKLR